MNPLIWVTAHWVIWPKQNLALTLAFKGKDVSLPIASDGLHIVLIQFFSNTQEHGDNKVTLVADQTDVMIEDDGNGMSDGNASRIFEPSLTTKRDSGGTGMGLFGGPQQIAGPSRRFTS